MELQTEIGDFELRFASLIENCGLSTHEIPLPTVARRTPGTPSFLFSTPSSLTRVSALSNLAEDVTHCNPCPENDQSLVDDSVEDSHDTTFSTTELDKGSEEKKIVKDTETSQLVPGTDVHGEKIYRVVEGCESETSMNRPCCTRASSIITDHMTLKEAKGLKVRGQKNSHPRACSTFIEKDDDNTSISSADDSTSTWATDDSSSMFCIGYDGKERFPLTSTKINLSFETDIPVHCVPDITDSPYTRNSKNFDQRHRSQTKHVRHLATGDTDISSNSTLGSMGEDSVFENYRVKQTGVPKTGSIRRQTCTTRLVDPKALAKKMKLFNRNLRNKKISLTQTLLVV
jgi:hypothetical protein